MSPTEYSTSLLRNPQEDYRNSTDLLEKRVLAAPEHIAFEIPLRDSSGRIVSWEPVTTAEFRSRVRTLARGLIAIGVTPGETVAILSPTRFEWALVDFACMYAGAVVVPIYDSSSSTQIEQIIEDAEVRLAFGGNDELCGKLQQVLGNGSTQTLVWSLDQHGTFPSVATLENAGESVAEAEVEQRRQIATLNDTATLVYTSGTTGVPKGAMITHRNFVGQVLNVAASYEQVVHEDGRTIIFLPLAHVLARGLQMICLANGMRIAHLSNPADLIPQLDIVRPTFLVVVPRVLEKIREAVAGKAQHAHLGRLWRRAEKVAVEVGRIRQQDGGAQPSIPAALRVQHAVYDRLFYSKIRKLMGDEVGWLLSGGAALAPELSLLFHGMGLPVIEGYGLTETTAPLCGNLPGDIKAGTVGIPLPGATVRIAENGEILAQGIGVFAGYRDSSFDAFAFTEDGFFRTGDLGELDDAGRLILKGRIKDDILTAGGKSISPFTWENAVEKDPWVAHAVMVGEGRKFLSALIVPELDSEAAGKDSAELEGHFALLVERANRLVARSEQVKKFRVVAIDSTDAALVTPTQKLRRGAFYERFEREISQMYEG